MKTLMLATAAVLAGAPAFAGGLTSVDPEPVIAPAPVPVAPSYDWTGGYVGGQLGYGDISSSPDGLEGDGAVGGVHAGYMWDFGNWVLGGELDYDIADIDLNDTGDTLDSVARLKARAGFDLGRTLLYGTVGIAQASADVAGSDLSDTGWLAGAGLGYQLTNQWMLGGEILYHEFDDFDNSGVDIEATTATLRASFRF